MRTAAGWRGATRDQTYDLHALRHTWRRKQERRQGGRLRRAIERLTFVPGDVSGGRWSETQRAIEQKTFALGNPPGDVNKSGGRVEGRDARSNG
jgi:hypothetical protein